LLCIFFTSFSTLIELCCDAPFRFLFAIQLFTAGKARQFLGRKGRGIYQKMTGYIEGDLGQKIKKKYGQNLMNRDY
jgi:hypothetical protein